MTTEEFNKFWEYRIVGNGLTIYNDGVADYLNKVISEIVFYLPNGNDIMINHIRNHWLWGVGVSIEGIDQHLSNQIKKDIKYILNNKVFY